MKTNSINTWEMQHITWFQNFADSDSTKSLYAMNFKEVPRGFIWTSVWIYNHWLR